MRSTTAVTPTAPVGAMPAREAIVESALRAFARHGFAAPLRAIAADAGVSAPLIVHHFGSKAGLRDAVDAHVSGLAREKFEVLDAAGPGPAAAWAFAMIQDGDVPRYLARVLVEDGRAGERLFRSFVEVVERALAALDLPEPRWAAAVLVCHSLGTMMLASHVGAATGVAPFSPEGLPALARATVALYRGALAPMLPEVPA